MRLQRQRCESGVRRKSTMRAKRDALAVEKKAKLRRTSTQAAALRALTKHKALLCFSSPI